MPVQLASNSVRAGTLENTQVSLHQERKTNTVHLNKDRHSVSILAQELTMASLGRLVIGIVAPMKLDPLAVASQRWQR